jgi:hypothetical protein
MIGKRDGKKPDGLVKTVSYTKEGKERKEPNFDNESTASEHRRKNEEI